LHKEDLHDLYSLPYSIKRDQVKMMRFGGGRGETLTGGAEKFLQRWWKNLKGKDHLRGIPSLCNYLLTSTEVS
jgi:hypothetical protein